MQLYTSHSFFCSIFFIETLLQVWLNQGLSSEISWKCKLAVIYLSSLCIFWISIVVFQWGQGKLTLSIFMGVLTVALHLVCRILSRSKVPTIWICSLSKHQLRMEPNCKFFYVFVFICICMYVYIYICC